MRNNFLCLLLFLCCVTFLSGSDESWPPEAYIVAAYKDIALAHEFIAEECVGRLEKILINPDKDICRAATRALGIINERYKRGNINYECRRILTNLLADPECSLEAQEAFEKNGCGDDFYLKKHLKRQRTE